MQHLKSIKTFQIKNRYYFQNLNKISFNVIVKLKNIYYNKKKQLRKINNNSNQIEFIEYF